jgi:hypothetical protein
VRHLVQQCGAHLTIAALDVRLDVGIDPDSPQRAITIAAYFQVSGDQDTRSR